MARSYEKSKGRSSKVSGFSMLIHAYFQSAEYAELSPRATKMLIDLYCQFRGENNGDLCATYSVMKKAGWSSNDQIQKAIAELLAKGWIIITRRGGRKLPTLYGLTFRGIDNTGKLNSHISSSPMPLHLWKCVNRHKIVLEVVTKKLWDEIEQSFHRTAQRVKPRPSRGSKVTAEMVH